MDTIFGWEKSDLIEYTHPQKYINWNAKWKRDEQKKYIYTISNLMNGLFYGWCICSHFDNAIHISSQTNQH